MTVERTLARVDQDLAAGRRDLARERLRGLCGSFPQRIDLRERLGLLYRADGELAQAGRWLYLSDQATERELRAFERSHRRNHAAMMWALSWRGDEDAAPTELARERLRELRERAETRVGGPLSWEPPSPAKVPATRVDKLVGGLLMGIGLFVIGLIVLGLFSLAVEGWDVLTDWVQ